jgi:hypothetical protein
MQVRTTFVSGRLCTCLGEAMSTNKCWPILNDDAQVDNQGWNSGRYHHYASDYECYDDPYCYACALAVPYIPVPLLKSRREY